MQAGLKGVVSTAGAGTLAMARKLQPDAITLDLGLSDIDGFVLLDLLKHDPQTGHAADPRHLGRRQASNRRCRMGAFGVTEKPAEHDALAKVFADLAASVEARRPAASRARPQPSGCGAPRRKRCPSWPAPRS